jgi:hypothetical protein
VTPLSLKCLGHCLDPWLGREAGVEDQARAVVDWEPKARVSPSSPRKAEGVMGYALVLTRMCARAHLMGVAPKQF